MSDTILDDKAERAAAAGHYFTPGSVLPVGAEPRQHATSGATVIRYRHCARPGCAARWIEEDAPERRYCRDLCAESHARTNPAAAARAAA